jgi:hypothetical protein
MAKIVEFEIEESLLEEIDEAAAVLGVSRTVFCMAAVKHALRHHYVKDFNEQDEVNSFLVWLVDEDEINGWSEVQDWSDPWDGPESDRLN